MGGDSVIETRPSMIIFNSDSLSQRVTKNGCLCGPFSDNSGISGRILEDFQTQDEFIILIHAIQYTISILQD